MLQMFKKNILATTILILSATLAIAQTGSIKVTLFDKATNETIPFANVVVEQGGKQVAVGQTNFDGEALIKTLSPGKYDVRATFVGYKTFLNKDVVVNNDNTAYLNIRLESSATDLDVVEVVEYTEPLIDPNTGTKNIIGRDEYQQMASKNINTVVANSAGVFQANENSALNVRGGRSDQTVYYIDGVKMIGSGSLPQGAVEEISIIVGGIPANIGDVTSGPIMLTSRGPSPRYYGNAEIITSQFLDNYGYNSLVLSGGGPIVQKKDSAMGKKTIVGFNLSGQFSYMKDPNPSAIGFYKINDDTLKYLEENPLRRSPNGTGFVRNAEFVDANDLEKIKAFQNVAAKGVSLVGRIDIKPTDKLVIGLGGAFDWGQSYGLTYEYALFNPKNNPFSTSRSWRAFARVTQKFGTQVANKEEKEKSTSLIINPYYSVQASFQHNYGRTEDDTHKDNLFKYGYIGKFKRYRGPNLGFDFATNKIVHEGYTDTLITFEASDVNKEASNYTTQFYDFAQEDNSKINSFDDIRQGLGLINGDRPSNIYSLWYNTGRQFGGYGVGESEQFSVTANFNADIKRHQLMIGFEFDQRLNRSYNIAPIGLWQLMRAYTNSHLTQIDTTNVIGNTVVFNPLTGVNDTVDLYQVKYDGTSQKFFDKQLRESLGLSATGTDFINVDELTPDQFKLEMFSPDDLLNNGAGVVNGGAGWAGYYGYDAYGNKLNYKPSFDDYFNKQDANGNFSRHIAPYQPIYMAGYILDKFDYRDLKFNVGLRVDRFDANQLVMKDKYLLYDTKTAREVTNLGTHPSNIGNDYAVYVDDVNNPSKILGYRDGNNWYDANGTLVEDPKKTIAEPSSTGKITPYLVNPNDKTISSKAFKDYTPQIVYMPRVSFSFPISDLANFFAHYDIVAKRPPGGQYTNPSVYQYLATAVQPVIPNPDLKPERTIDYEVGFEQVLSERKNSVLKLSAFYRELRDMIQITRVYQAHPNENYFTYDNLDFGTVKGFSATYDLRRTNGVTFYATYTLQFAEGTGSGATDGFSLVSSGQPNLRTTIPLDFDQRHTITANFDYRFGAGKDYRGPVWTRRKGTDNEKNIQLLQDLGAHLNVVVGSGTPYSRQNQVTRSADFTAAQRSTLEGSINGSSLPWTYRMDLRVDRNIVITLNKDNAEKKKETKLQVYVLVLNLLNTKNVVNVYRYTGNADDDGFLASADGQQYVSQQLNPQSYSDLYKVRVANPFNYSVPRRIRLGLLYEF